jgi:hypothetical protein
VTAKDSQSGQPARTAYQPTQRERAAFEAWKRHQDANPSPRVKVKTEQNKQKIEVDHPESAAGHLLLMEAIGSFDTDFLDGLLAQLREVASHDTGVSEKELNFQLAVIKSIKPKDQIEVMLAAQMAAIHLSNMTLANRLGTSPDIARQDSAARALNKAVSSFSNLVAALRHHRGGREQKITVQYQHVSVNEGGQAIVGNVAGASTRRSRSRKCDQPAMIEKKIEQPLPLQEGAAADLVGRVLPHNE